MVEILGRLRDQYGNPPVYIITENGACYDDPAPAGGTVADAPRVEFLRQHLLAAERADKRGLRPEGLFRLVAARQFRVGGRLAAAIRHRPCRLRHRYPHAESLLRIPRLPLRKRKSLVEFAPRLRFVIGTSQR